MSDEMPNMPTWEDVEQLEAELEEWKEIFYSMNKRRTSNLEYWDRLRRVVRLVAGCKACTVCQEIAREALGQGVQETPCETPKCVCPTLYEECRDRFAKHGTEYNEQESPVPPPPHYCEDCHYWNGPREGNDYGGCTNEDSILYRTSGGSFVHRSSYCESWEKRHEQEMRCQTCRYWTLADGATEIGECVSDYSKYCGRDTGRNHHCYEWRGGN